MTTAGIRSHGLEFSISTGDSPEGFVAIAEAQVVPPLGGKNDLIDASSHDTVDYMDYLVKSLADGNELAVPCIYSEDDAGQIAMRAAYAAKTQYYFKVTLTNATYFTFPGRVMGWEIAAGELDDIVKETYTVKITGAISKT